jgi:formamidopyrimidine-DNA glycosylase
MPELPEIEIVKRSLFKMINKAKIINITINNPNLRYKITNKFSKNLVGEKILKISRRSKYLIIHFRKKLLLIHLGMSGKLLLLRKRDKTLFKTSFYYNLKIIPKHNHIYFFLNNGLVLIYNDVRRFGFFKLFNNNDLKKISFLKKLGLEPLGSKFNENYFENYTKNKDKNVKNLLMDQTFVSGLGNIYVNEVLFMSKIHPLKHSRRLSKKKIKILTLSIKKVLRDSISKGGSSIKDFVSSQGKSGTFQEFFKVYGKENEDCSRNSCGGKIKKIFVSNRSTFYCNKCQS